MTKHTIVIEDDEAGLLVGATTIGLSEYITPATKLFNLVNDFIGKKMESVGYKQEVGDGTVGPG